MTQQVTFTQGVGGDGSTYSDAAAPAVGGLANGGHRDYFFPLLQQLIVVANFLVARAQAAADAATSAVNAPGTSATTASAVSVSAGSRSIVLNELNKAYVKGQRVSVASNANPLNAVSGPITAFVPSTGAMTINVDTTSGTGSFSDGIISLAATGGVPTTRQISTAGLATGGGDLTVNRVINVIASSAADIRAGTRKDATVTPGDITDSLADVTLQFGTSISTIGDTILDANKFTNGRITMSGNSVLPNISNATPGTYRITFVQDNVGGRDLTSWGNAYQAVGGRPTLSSAPGASTYFYIDVINTGLMIVSAIKGATN